jgi:hypothetical protein
MVTLGLRYIDSGTESRLPARGCNVLRREVVQKMPRHNEMGAQRTATARNARAEFVAGYLLGLLAVTIPENDAQVASVELGHQVSFRSDIASDVWDHRVQVRRRDDAAEGGEELFQVWAQTTCYKGNSIGRPEPNKTYEIRETLIESLTLRASIEENAHVRTIHFTFGPRDYGYGWFPAAKQATFDLSLWVSIESKDIHDEIFDCLDGAILETEKNARLANEIQNKTELGRALSRVSEQLKDWWNQGAPCSNVLVSVQAACMNRRRPRVEDVAQLIEGSSTASIKENVVAALCSGRDQGIDTSTQAIVWKIEEAKPFFRDCRKHISHWDEFMREVTGVLTVGDSVFASAVKLWGVPSPLRESVRRVLPRLVDAEGVEYIADVGVRGVTEQGFYSNDYSVDQKSEIVKSFIDELMTRANTTQELVDLFNRHGRQILRTRLYFEARNGTKIKPSMLWVEKFLGDCGYKVVNSASASGENLRGFHSNFPASEGVHPYTNFMAVRNNNGKNIGLVKAKYFSAKEFDRRCKEEAYVGFTLRYDLTDTVLVDSCRPPLIMYVDKDADTIPNVRSISKLVAAGWDVCFSGEQLLRSLDARAC